MIYVRSEILYAAHQFTDDWSLKVPCSASKCIIPGVVPGDDEYEVFRDYSRSRGCLYMA